MRRIIAGKIEKVFGLNGEVKIVPLTSDINRFSRLKRLYFDEEGDIYKEIENVRFSNKHVIIKFKDIDNVEKAKKILNFFIYINVEDVDPLKDESNEIYYFELQNFELYDKNICLGKIKEIMETNTFDSIFLVFDKDEYEYIIPFNKFFIEKIDREKKRIYINNFDKIVGIKK